METFCNELNAWLQPPKLKQDNKPSLAHLSHRLQSLHGTFNAEQKLIEDSNENIVQRINHFLGHFSKSLDSMRDELNDMGIETYRDNSQGNHHAWYVQRGDEGYDNVYFWQNYITARIRKLPGASIVSFFAGVCIQIGIERSAHGIKYIENGPVSAAAAIAINTDKENSIVNLKKYAGEIREFVLSGPEEEIVYHEFLALLENNFESGFELALQELETLN